MTPTIGTLLDISTDSYKVYHTFNKDGDVIGFAYVGKSKKINWRFKFPNGIEQLTNYAQEKIDNYQSIINQKAEKRLNSQLAKKNHNIKVGDIFCSTWGYDCSINDYYQVVDIDKQTMSLRKISKSVVKEEFTYVEVLPNKDSFIGEVFKKRIGFSYSNFYFNVNSFQTAFLLDKIVPRYETHSLCI